MHPSYSFAHMSCGKWDTQGDGLVFVGSAVVGIESGGVAKGRVEERKMRNSSKRHGAMGLLANDLLHLQAEVDAGSVM